MTAYSIRIASKEGEPPAAVARQCSRAHSCPPSTLRPGYDPMTPTIREETAADHGAVRQVHRLAFGQDDEAALVDALREGGHVRVSLVAEAGGRVVGHVLFSDLTIRTDAGAVAA